MRKTLIIACLSLFAAAGQAQVPWTFRESSVSMTVLVETDSLFFEREILLPGDAVGVFYDSLGFMACAGFGELDQGANGLEFQIYGKDAQVDFGLEDGDDLIFKVWRNEEQCQAEFVDVTFAGDTAVEFSPEDTALVLGLTGFKIDFYYSDESYCQNDSDPLPDFEEKITASYSSSGSGLSIDGQTGRIDLSASIPGTYEVFIEGISCLNNSSTSVTILQSPQNIAMEKEISECEIQSVVLRANSGFEEYRWSTGDTTSSITTSQAGLYWVEAELNGCSNRDTISVRFGAPDLSGLQFETVDEGCESGGQLIIDPLSISGGSPPFDFVLTNVVDNTQQVSSTGSFINLSRGNYALRVESLDSDCSSDYSDEIVIDREPDCDAAVLTPDENGVAGQFLISTPGEAKIYDRRGSLRARLQTPAYWDGRDSKGEVLPAGVYLIIVNGRENIQLTIVR